MKQLLFVLAIVAMAFSSCKKVNGDGPTVTETRNVGDFVQLHYAIGGTLYFEHAATYSIEIRAQRNILDVIELKQRSNQELEIRLRDNTVIYSHEPIEVIARGPSLQGVHLSGSGTAKLLQPLETQRFWLETSGSGDIQVGQLTATELETRISGSGRIDVVNGEVTTARFNISGSGKMETSGLKAQQVYTTSSGSGDMRIWAEDYLEAKISGSGSVLYKGSPQVKISISGSGKVQAIN